MSKNACEYILRRVVEYEFIINSLICMNLYEY